MGRVIDQKYFEVRCKDDLYVTVLVKVGEDYHGCGQYDRHTPFGLAKNNEEFKHYLNMLSDDEIIEYRDDYDGCILHDMVTCNLSKKCFDEVCSRIGNYYFIKLLEMKDRFGNYAISNVRDLELFKYLIQFSGINGVLIRQVSLHCPISISNYLAEIVNNELFNDD